MKDYLHRHDPACKQLVESFGKTWNIKDPLTTETVETRMSRNAKVDEALHAVIRRGPSAC